MNRKIKIICFDLDGVLIDSINNMSFSWDMTCKKNNLKIPFSRYRKHIGLPFFKILKNLNLKSNYKKINNDYNNASKEKIDLIKFYLGTKNTLKDLKKKFILGIITSKNKDRVNKILKKFKISFDFVFTPDDINRGKPYPDAIFEIVKKYNIKSSEIIYIGDTLNDSKFAKNAKINFLFADWGYGTTKNKKLKKINKISDIYKFL